MTEQGLILVGGYLLDRSRLKNRTVMLPADLAVRSTSGPCALVSA